MSGVQHERTAPTQLQQCPSCRKATPHELRLRRRGVEVWVCRVCGLASLLPADEARPTARPRP